MLAVKGDINGDGKVSSTDLSIFKLVYVKSRKVEYIYEKAVDMNNDDKITATDLSQLKMMLVGMPLPEEGQIQKRNTMAPNPFEIEGKATRTKNNNRRRNRRPNIRHNRKRNNSRSRQIYV